MPAVSGGFLRTNYFQVEIIIIFFFKILFQNRIKSSKITHFCGMWFNLQTVDRTFMNPLHFLKTVLAKAFSAQHETELCKALDAQTFIDFKENLT